MELVDHLVEGFRVAAAPWNVLYCLAGVTLGTVVGILPGLGPVVAISLLLPITFHLPAVSALIMLAGVYYGAQYGGSTTAILVNLPGESSSVVTCLDGYAMARQGRAGPALGVAALGSFFAGCVATAIVALFAPPLAEIGLRFGAPEYFALMVLGLVSAVALAHGSLLKAIAMVVLGLLFGLVGTDVNSGAMRFTFGALQLYDGISFVIVAIGLFGLAEIVLNLERTERREVLVSKVQGVLPTWADLKASWKAVVRGTALGSALGILPGTGATISAFAAYSLEKRLAREPARFGAGAIEGVAGPESANNAAAQTHFIPMLTLGIPAGPTMAVMLGAMTIQGIAPGPEVMSRSPDLFWGMITSMWIGNALLVVLNLPLLGVWIRLLTIPYRLLYPTVLLLSCVGMYSLNSSVFDVGLTAAFGLLGYVFARLDCEPAPLMLGLILGPMMEEYLRRSLLLSRGDPAIFLDRPATLGMLTAAALVLALVVVPSVRRGRTAAFGGA